VLAIDNENAKVTNDEVQALLDLQLNYASKRSQGGALTATDGKANEALPDSS